MMFAKTTEKFVESQNMLASSIESFAFYSLSYINLCVAYLHSTLWGEMLSLECIVMVHM